MRKTMFTLLGTLACLAAPVFAQQTPGSAPSPQAGQAGAQVDSDPQAPTSQVQTERRLRAQQQRAGQRQPGEAQMRAAGPAMRSSDIVGLEVRDRQNEEVGTIDDLVIDLQTGRIRYAALSVGGVLGIGDSLFAVPWSAFRLQGTEGDRHLVINASAQQFEDAPGFKKDAWPNMADTQWQTTNDAYYSERGIYTTRRNVDRDRTGVDVQQNGVRQSTDRQIDVRQNTDRTDGVRQTPRTRDGVRQSTDRQIDVRQNTERQEGTLQQDGVRRNADRSDSDRTDSPRQGTDTPQPQADSDTEQDDN